MSEIDPTLPEVVQRFLREGGKLENITLHAEGYWSHEGARFENQRVIDLFSRSVSRTEGGTWVLRVGQFTYPITVEGCAFFVRRADWDASPPTIDLSDQTTEPLDPTTLRYAPGGRLTCAVKGGQHEARFLRHPYYQLIDRVTMRGDEAMVRVGDVHVSLGALDED